MIKVLIVDDSALVRATLTQILEAANGIEVVGTAPDARLGWRKIKALKPDVLTLDIEMPKVDGITFLRKLMVHRPMPVVMISSLTEAGARVTLDALSAGAVDFVTKPGGMYGAKLPDVAAEVVRKVRAAAHAKVGARTAAQLKPRRRLGVDEVLERQRIDTRGAPPVICIGASAGGTVALERVLRELPVNLPPIVVVQHMPAGYTGPFAERLDTTCKLHVFEARDRTRVRPGDVAIAPGGRHLLLQRQGSQYWLAVRDAPPVNRHRPSVDVLFRSAANSAGSSVVGVLLTGMGDDGARGMRDLFDVNAVTFAQDEASCLVYGMPRAAVELGAVRLVLSPDEIVAALQATANGLISS